MTSINPRWRNTVAMTAAIAIGFATSAYGASKDAAGEHVTAAESSLSLGSSDKSVEALVPDEFKKKGSLIIAVSATHPPNAFFDEQNKLVGWEVDLGNAITTRMNLKPDFEKVEFAQILTGLQSGRYDIGLSGISDTTVRQKVVTFVDYFNAAGTSLVVKGGNPQNIGAMADLCGHTVAIETGTIQIDMAEEQSKKCVAEDKKPVDIKIFPAQSQVQLQIRNGRADAGLNDFPVAAYIAKLSEGQLDAVHSEGVDDAFYGIAVDKDSPELVKAIQAAVQAVISDGTYMKILEKWNLQDGAIESATIDATGK